MLSLFQRDTLIRYLLDELYTYEEDHSNALCPNSQPKALLLGSSPELELFQDIRNDVNTQVTVMKTELQQAQQEYHTLLNQAFTLNTIPHAVSINMPLPSLTSLPSSSVDMACTPIRATEPFQIQSMPDNIQNVCFFDLFNIT